MGFVIKSIDILESLKNHSHKLQNIKGNLQEKRLIIKNYLVEIGIKFMLSSSL